MNKLVSVLALTTMLALVNGCQSTGVNRGSQNKTAIPVEANVSSQSRESSKSSLGVDNRIDNAKQQYVGITPNHSATSIAANTVMANSALSPKPINNQYQSLTALEMAKQNPDLSIMVEAIEAAGISGMIRFAGDRYTILAPNNAAFNQLFSDTSLTKETLLAKKSFLRSLLSYHVIKAQKPLTIDQIQPNQFKTLHKKQFTIDSQKNITDGKGRVAHIVTPNIMTKNGTVHIIDNVLLP